MWHLIIEVSLLYVPLCIKWLHVKDCDGYLSPQSVVVFSTIWNGYIYLEDFTIVSYLLISDFKIVVKKCTENSENNIILLCKYC